MPFERPEIDKPDRQNRPPRGPQVPYRTEDLPGVVPTPEEIEERRKEMPRPFYPDRRDN